MLRKILSVALFPFFFTVSFLTAFMGLKQGYSIEKIVIALTLVHVFIVFITEKYLPFYPEWNIPKKDKLTDFIHNLVSVLGVPLIRSSIFVLFLALHSFLKNMGFDLWPHHWPLPAQVVLGCVLAELVLYWAHRLTHEKRFFWPLHVVHHSSERLYWMNAAREHPLGNIYFYCCEISLMVILGASPEVIGLETLVTSIVGVWQHANINVKLGPLNYLFSMSEVHRWHHSKNLKEANTNFGSNFVIWDHVFGTFFWPRDKKPPVDVGLGDTKNFPQGYWGQFLAIFRLKKIT